MRTRFDFLECFELCNDSWYGLIIVLVLYRHIAKDSACMLDLVKPMQLVGHQNDIGMLVLNRICFICLFVSDSLTI